MEPTERFSRRADNYSKYRPTYPDALIQFMDQTFELNDRTIVADIGSGTGILSELLLEQGYEVKGVEPNQDMRTTAETKLSGFKRFISVSGTGEQTHLADHSVSLVTVAQAFHWLDPIKAKAEFRRILKKHGHIALIWNLNAAQTPFGKAYEALKIKYGTNYQAIRKSHEPDLDDFFAPEKLNTISFPHAMHLDLQGLKGQLLSSSFMPLEGQHGFTEMDAETEDLFSNYQENGLVRIEYITHLHYNSAG